MNGPRRFRYQAPPHMPQQAYAQLELAPDRATYWAIVQRQIKASLITRACAWVMRHPHGPFRPILDQSRRR